MNEYIMVGKFFLFIVSLFAGNSLFAQYTLNGNATQNDCHCYTLTNDAFSLSGSIWNNNKINLTQSFEFKFDVFLGCADAQGADGIVFVLQPVSTSVGAQGGGLGYSGVSPAVGVTIDTWQNGSPTTSDGDGDPVFDHIAIQLNGDLNHRDSVAPWPVNNIAGPVTALAGSDNIEDCQWHILGIRWDENTKTLSAYVDGVLRVSATKDFTNDVFSGNPLVFWGFTGSTGGSKNLQQMCTALKPMFRFLPNQKRCPGEKITFFDSTISFAPLRKSYWNFGDGSPIDSVSANPAHVYVAAGNYTVVQTVLGADGCTEVNTQQLIIGSVPLAEFTFNNACSLDSSVNFINTSSATFGTINNWFWDFGSGDSGTSQHPSKVFATAGFKSVRLAVKSLEGCVSDTTVHIVQVYEKPTADFSFIDDQCMNTTIQFSGVSTSNDGTINDWRWNADSGKTRLANTQNPTYKYNSPGQHLVSLVTKSTNGCASNIVIKPVNILPQPVANFNSEPVCLLLPSLFTDSSYITGANEVINWWWDLGNGIISTSKNPITTYHATGDITIQLVVKSNTGCISDTLKRLISIESRPLAKFGYTMPLCENKSIQFTDSSIAGSGPVEGWFWSFDNGSSSDIQNAIAVFTGGNHQIKLVVKDSKGCNSDTTNEVVFVYPRPVVDFTVLNACKNTVVSFKGIIRSGDSITQWQWNFDDGSISASKDTQHVYTSGGNFAVKLFGISATGCHTDTLQRDIIIYATNAFAGNDTIAATNQPVQLTGSGGINYEWSPATGLSNPAIFNPIAVNNGDRSYILRAYTPFGCESFDTIHLKIYDGPEIYVASAFTPNGDGLNEILHVLPAGVKKFKYFRVYNRFGQVVFITTVSSIGWDGFYKGKAQNPGVYLWTASAIGYAGNEIFRKGTVILIR
ncbi:MAG: PKD domain-containing protein [Ferruginibacter sp.]